MVLAILVVVYGLCENAQYPSASPTTAIRWTHAPIETACFTLAIPKGAITPHDGWL
jgi:hypothetical protein